MLSPLLLVISGKVSKVAQETPSGFKSDRVSSIAPRAALMEPEFTQSLS
jgi:hypothetical protein